MNRRSWLAAGMLLAAWHAPPARADDLKATIQKIAEEWSKVRSIQAKVTEREKVRSRGAAVTRESEGTFEFQREAGKLRTRTEMSWKRLSGADHPDDRHDVQGSSQLINDGDFVYDARTSFGKTQIYKQAATAADSPDPAKIMDNLRRAYTLRLLPETKVEEQEAHLIEAVAKKPKPGEPDKKFYYFRKGDGVLLKIVGLDHEGHEVVSVAYTDIKLNERIDPQRFRFVQPPDATFIDRTPGGETKP